MRILGIDPGLQATGYGVIDVTTDKKYQITLLEAGSIEPQKKAAFQAKLQKIYLHLDDIVKQYTPDVIVVEKLYSHYRHPTTACILGHVRGVIFLLSAHRQLPIVEHSVKRIRIALLGNGNASKQQTREFIQRTFNVTSQKLTLDASDALALAIGYAYMQRR